MTDIHSDILGHLPLELKHNMQTVMGAFRDATRNVAPDGGRAEIHDRAVRAVEDRPNLYSEKGRDRLVKKLRREFGDRLLSGVFGKDGPGKESVSVTVASVSPNELHLFDINFVGKKGFGVGLVVDEIGRVSRHAVGRFVQRSGRTAVTLWDIAKQATTTLRFATIVHTTGPIYHKLIPVPTGDGALVAVIDIREHGILTFLRSSTAGAARAEWIARFMKLDNMVGETGGRVMHYMNEYRALLNEGGQVFGETKDGFSPGHRDAA